MRKISGHILTLRLSASMFNFVEGQPGYNFRYHVDLAMKEAFLNNKFSVSLSVNDIFKTRKQDQYSSSDYFVQEYYRVRDQQMVRLNLAYNFGKIDALLFKRKSQGTGQTGSESVQ